MTADHWAKERQMNLSTIKPCTTWIRSKIPNFIPTAMSSDLHPKEQDHEKIFSVFVSSHKANKI